MREAIVAILLIAGVAVAVLATLGVLLMREPMDRLHFTGAAVPAVLLIAAAVLVENSASLIGLKAIAIAAATLVAAPVLSHATARTIRAVEERPKR